jgi:PAS domain S-box-containing protein
MKEAVKILLVEDDPVHAELIVQGFGNATDRFDVALARTIDQARTILNREQFDLIIADYVLPDGHGIDLLPYQWDRQIPLVIITAYGDERLAVDVLKRGAVDYISKRENTFTDIAESANRAIEQWRSSAEQRRVQQQLKIQQERYRTLVESAGHAIVVVQDDKPAFVNSRAVQMIDRPEPEILSIAWQDIFHPDDRAELLEHWWDPATSEPVFLPGPFRIVGQDGSIKWMHINCTPTTWNDQPANLLFLADITQRKLNEDQILKAKQEWERTFDAVPDLIAIIGLDFKIARLNRAMADRLCLSVEEAIGQPCFALVHRTDGPPVFCPHSGLMRDGREHSVEARLDVLDGTFIVSASPIRDQEGRLHGCVHVARDITALKKAQDTLIQSERFEAVADLATGVAHNFSNLLQIIMGNCQLALADLEQGHTHGVRNYLSQILESARFGAKTVRRLQDYAKLRFAGSGNTTRSFDLSELARQAAEITRPWWKTNPERMGQRIDMTLDLGTGCSVTGHENQMFEVIVNLLKNAAEAMPAGGKITVRTWTQEGTVVLQVSDTGQGISPEHLGKVFDPFWTTKGIEGTGMGLTVSHGTVTSHGGLIKVTSEHGKGSAFTVTLPLSPGNLPDGALP